MNRRAMLAGGTMFAAFAATPHPPVTVRPEVVSAFWEPVDREMIAWLDIAPSATALDAGCGRGDHLRLFAERCRAVGVDINPERLNYAKKRVAGSAIEGRIELRQADISSLPFEDGSFDLVWASHVFHGSRNIAGMARELRRMLKPGGRFAIRENRVTASLLPADLGFGPLALEARADAAFATWLAEDRVKRGRYPHLWGQILRDAGMRDVRAKSFLHELNAPFTDAQKEYFCYHLARKAEWKLSREDRRTLREISDPASPRHVLNRQDLYYVSVSTVYIGIL